MSTEYRFSHPDYDILTNPNVDCENHVIGNSRSDYFAWCDFNGFNCILDVQKFMEANPQLVIRDESDNEISFVKFKELVEGKRIDQVFAMPLDFKIQSASTRAAESKPASPAKTKEPEPEL